MPNIGGARISLNINTYATPDTGPAFLIAVAHRSGPISVIHGMQDGAPSSTGRCLRYWYTDEKKIADLLLGGGLIYLSSGLDTCKRDGDRRYYVHRDLAEVYEEWGPVNGGNAEYIYLWVEDGPGQWTCADFDEWPNISYLPQEKAVQREIKKAARRGAAAT